MSEQEFITSLRDSERKHAEAVQAEMASDYSDALLSMERAYEEGFVDAMRHAYTLLTGWPAPCDHDKYSESIFACSQHGDDAPCHERHCDNCDEVMLHEREDGADDEEAN